MFVLFKVLVLCLYICMYVHTTIFQLLQILVSLLKVKYLIGWLLIIFLLYNPHGGHGGAPGLATAPS